MRTVFHPPGSLSPPTPGPALPCPLDKSQSTHEIIPGHAVTSRSRSKPRGLQASSGRWGLCRVSRTSPWTVCLAVSSHSLPASPALAVQMGALLIAGPSENVFSECVNQKVTRLGLWALG